MTIQPVIEPEPTRVIGGVDTHKNTHYAAAVDDHGRFLGHREFPANDRGYQQLLTWMQEQGDILTIGVEMRHHQPTRDYVERRTAEGLSKREIIRCLKRYIAREVFANLPRSAPADIPIEETPSAA